MCVNLKISFSLVFSPLFLRHHWNMLCILSHNSIFTMLDDYRNVFRFETHKRFFFFWRINEMMMKMSAIYSDIISRFIQLAHLTTAHTFLFLQTTKYQWKLETEAANDSLCRFIIISDFILISTTTTAKTKLNIYEFVPSFYKNRNKMEIIATEANVCASCMSQYRTVCWSSKMLMNVGAGIWFFS